MRTTTPLAAALAVLALTACTPSAGVEEDAQAVTIPAAPVETETGTAVADDAPAEVEAEQVAVETEETEALEALYSLPVVAHDIAPYDRDDFGGRWVDFDGTGCTTRQDVLRRDATEWVGDGCQPEQLVVQDRYTGTAVVALSPGDIDIDHVVSAHDAWLTGAQGWDDHTRVAFYQDKLNLVAVGSSVNRSKSDLNAAQWLPPYEAGRCDFAARQVAVKAKWGLGVTDAEQDALAGVLHGCPGQTLPTGDEPTPVFDTFPYLTGSVPVTDDPAPANPAPADVEPVAPVTDAGGEVHYANCDAVRAAGAAPIRSGQPGYRAGLDRDGDGVGCE